MGLFSIIYYTEMGNFNYLSVCRKDESCLMLPPPPHPTPPLLSKGKLMPPSSVPPTFPSTFFYPGKPPATLLMTHSTHLLYCAVGGPGKPKQ